MPMSQLLQQEHSHILESHQHHKGLDHNHKHITLTTISLFDKDGREILANLKVNAEWDISGGEDNSTEKGMKTNL